MKLSKLQIITIENELENKESLIVSSRGRRILIKRRQRRIWPCEQNTKTIRVYKEDLEKIKGRAEFDGTSMSVALDNMLIEAYRRKVIRMLQGVLLTKARGIYIYISRRHK